MTEDEIVGWHHHFNGNEFGQTLGYSERQGGQECCSPWGRKELYMTTANIVALTVCAFVGKVISLLFNMLSRFVTLAT